MHWLYHLTQPQPAQGAVAQKVYLRAVKPGMEQAEERQVSQIVLLHVFAMDFYFGLADNPLNTDEGRQIYETELSRKDYFIQIDETEDMPDHLLAQATLYLKTDRFDEPELLDWVKVYLSVQGYPHDAFEKTDLAFFPEMNAILSLFSLENVREFEGELGKEWWKSDNPPTDENDQHPTNP